MRQKIPAPPKLKNLRTKQNLKISIKPKPKPKNTDMNNAIATQSAAATPATANKGNLDVRNSARAVALRESLASIPVSRKTGIEIQNLGQAAILAELFVNGGYAPKGASVEYATVAIMQGAMLGLNPIQSVQGIAVVNGHPTLYGDALAAVVKSSPLFAGETVEWLNGKGADGEAGCKFTVFRLLPDGTKQPTVEWFTTTDAKRAGLLDKIGPWRTNPRQMLFNRARAFAYRHAFPDVLQGVRSYEEEQDVIDVEPLKDAPPRSVPKAERPAVNAAAASKLRRTLGIAAPAEQPVALDIGAPAEKEVAPAPGATVEPTPEALAEAAAHSQEQTLPMNIPAPEKEPEYDRA